MYSPPVRGGTGAQQMQTIGRGAPQQGNYGGGRSSGSMASMQRVPGLANALSGQQRPVPPGPQRPAGTGMTDAGRIPGYGNVTQRPVQQPTQPQPQQGQNRAFANWGEPGSAYGQPPPPPAPQQGAGATWTGAPVQGYRMDTSGGVNAMMDRRGMSGGGYSPPMMGPATGQMSLSGALTQHGQPRANTAQTRYTARDANGNYYEVPEQQDDSGTAGGTAAGGGGGGFDPKKYLEVLMSPETVSHNVNSISPVSATIINPENNADVAQDLGYEAGRAAGAFPAGMAGALNEYTKRDLGNYYDNWQDIGGLKSAGESLMDPAQQAAADAAERAQMQAGINSQRDEALRMMMGQQGRGGMVGSGASTGLLNSALRAQALGEQSLAQDQYQRMLGRNQLGGQLISDYGRQKYGLMNDAYASPGEIAALLLQGAQTGVDVANKLPLSKNPFLG
jgi:hypothetical protein